ncbi:hypothetical protein GCM10009557_40950 [Virgisporangium ochraceum]|uniref:Uncharacterized protein n=1 Tax=Virgisporangium ochraceum TaxID=65505 RepID=A0A8J4A3U8_9ACTN|nr:hypothetical protein [Virgisporangium ochraceum]GIJ72860.1 hypothetical protein Voc01_077770 [Virgisporangium ochraceum]
MAVISRKDPGRRGVGRRLGWLGLVAVLVANLLTVALGGAPASAAGVACPDVQWTHVGGRPPNWRGHVYTLHAVTPTFNVSDARTVINGLDTPASATFTSQQSRTYELSVTAGFSASFFGFLTANVSATIVQSRTTSIGVSATATVPAHGRVDGQYGIEAYNITYTAHQYRFIGSNLPPPGKKSCIDEGVKSGTTNAPTTVEGWRLIAG